MKYIDLHSWPTEKPDEKEYKESIIALLCDHFCHENITFILTRDHATLPEYGKHVIVFLSANEPSRHPTYSDKVGLIYTDFWTPEMPKNVKNIPLGFNERTSGRFIAGEKITPITERSIDMCFVGSHHGTNSHRMEMLASLNKIDPSIKKVVSTYSGFFYQPNNYEEVARKNGYIDLLYNTKISLCPGGNASSGSGHFAGWETYRFNESQRAGNIIVCNYDWSEWYKGPNVIVIDSWSNLTTQFVHNLLKQDLDTLQRQGIKNYKEKISRVNVLNSIVNDIESLLGAGGG